MKNGDIKPAAAPPGSEGRNWFDEGRELRKSVPRSALAEWKPPANRPDPVVSLLASSKHRLEHLLPLRFGRMSQSAFAYMRGSAGMMASDLSSTPTTGIHVQVCGDCHLGNFGAFASPERRVLFDITDFDETLPGPWEYDVKRLATSFVLLARHQGYDRKTVRAVTLKMLAAYRNRMNEFASLSPLDIWYYIIDSELLIRTAPDKATRRRRIRFEKKARERTAEKLLGKLIVEQNGRVQFTEHLPVIARLETGGELETAFRTVLERYPKSLSDDRRYLLSRYRLDDLAFKVVGVGSVGTRCAVALYVSPAGRRLILQVKEATSSVLEEFVGKGQFSHQGQRVVVGQRLMQCASDIFLGWASDDKGRSYYVRQLRDMKTNLPTEVLIGPVLFNFADMCGWALARAHAKSGDPMRLSGYIGKSDQLDKAMLKFAESYADQCEKDYEVFMQAVRDKKLPVQIEAPVAER